MDPSIHTSSPPSPRSRAAKLAFCSASSAGLPLLTFCIQCPAGCHCPPLSHPNPMVLFWQKHFIVLLIFASIIDCQSCIGNCSTMLKHSLSAIIGGYKASRADLLAPLHSIIKQSTNNVVVRRKTEWICLSIEKFKLCSDVCNDNRHKMVELANVGHWGSICDALFSSPRSFADFISCQRKHMEEVNRKCQHSLPTPVEETMPASLKRFCGKMREYTKCYAETRLKCNRNATKIYRQITDSIGHSFARIQQLSRGHLNIPDDCQQPIAQSVRAIVEKESGEEDGEGFRTSVADYWTDGGGEEEWLGREANAGQSSGKQQLKFGLISFFFILLILCWSSG